MCPFNESELCQASQIIFNNIPVQIETEIWEKCIKDVSKRGEKLGGKYVENMEEN